MKENIPSFIYAKNSKRDIIICNAHYRDCCKNNIPFAVIKIRKKWATVSIDLITTRIMSVSQKTQDELMEICRKYCNKTKETMTLKKNFTITYGTGIYSFFTPIPISCADEIMKEMLLLIKNKIHDTIKKELI